MPDLTDAILMLAGIVVHVVVRRMLKWEDGFNEVRAGTMFTKLVPECRKHAWSRWSKPVMESRYISRQYRTCLRCGKIEEGHGLYYQFNNKHELPM